MVPKTYHFSVGEFHCIAINERDREAPADVMFGNVAADERARVLAEFDLLSRGVIPNAINILYLDTGDHRVLVDTGLGQGGLQVALEAEGIARASIDRVIITHGHGDHIGGIVGEDGQAVFPNAAYFVGQVEWDYWLNHPDKNNRHIKFWEGLRGVVPAERVHFVDTEREFMPGFSAQFIPGHTPGQMGLRIESGGEQLLHIADVAHHPLQCVYPQWSVSFDADRGRSRDTRWQVWTQAANENLLVMSYHIRQFGLGHVVDTGEIWTWEPLVS